MIPVFRGASRLSFRTYRTDSLTGLLNHAAFKNDTEMKLLEGSSTAMMIMMDVDRFKQYNDTYGHQNGDEFAAMLFFDKSVPEAPVFPWELCSPDRE